MTLRPEIELLLRCARSQGLGGAAGEERLAEGIDWNELIRLSDDHGLLPALRSFVEVRRPQGIPAPAQELLSQYAASHELRGRILSEELLRLLDLLEDRGLVAIPFKGPTLSALAYDRPGLRQFGDLDLLVRPQDFVPAQDLLESLGYRRVRSGLTRLQERVHRWADNEHEFLSKDGLVSVDLHWGLTPRWFPCHLETTELWSRLQPVWLSGRRVRTFSIDTLLVVLCVHGAKDSWRRLAWVCDLDRLLKPGRDVDWESVKRQARAAHAERALALGLDLAHRLLGTPLPTAQVERIRSLPWLPALADAVSRRTLAQAGRPGRLARCFSADWLHLAVCDRFRDRLAYLGHCVFTPDESDWTWMRLPDSVFLLYYALRPLRLAARYARALLTDRVA